MTWQLRIPFRSREQPLAEIGDLARAVLDGDDRAVAREVALQAAADGARTLGDVLDRLEAAGSEGRRQLLDDARQAAGLERATAIDARREQAQRLRWPPAPPRGPTRDESGRAVQVCGATSCERRPTTPEGALKPVADRRWWCPEHRHLAQPGDDEPYSERLRVSPATGLPMMSAEAEAHYTAVYAQAAAEGRARTEQRAAEAEAIQVARERHEEAVKDDDYRSPRIAGMPTWRARPR